MDGLRRAPGELQRIGPGCLDFFCSARVVAIAPEPAGRGVVIVGTRVANAVLFDFIRIELRIIDFELQHHHARNAVILAQRIDLRRYDAEVLGHDREFAQCVLHGNKQRVARTGQPLSALGRFRAERY